MASGVFPANLGSERPLVESSDAFSAHFRANNKKLIWLKLADNVRESAAKKSILEAHKRLTKRIPYQIIRKCPTFNLVEYACGLLGIPKWIVPIILFILL